MNTTQTENLTPYGLTTNHFENLLTTKNRLWLRDLGHEGISNTLQSYQDTFDKAMREMLHDGGRESQLGKLKILARMSKNMKKQMMDITEYQLELSGKQILELSEIGERMPGDTPANREIREILRTQNISNERILEMAKEDKALVCSLLSSPHPKLAYGFSKEQLGELEAINFRNQLGEEKHQLLKNAIKTHDVLKDAQKTMNDKFDRCIEAADKNSYGSSSAIVAAAS